VAEHTYALFLLVGMKSYYEQRSRSSDQLKISSSIMMQRKQSGEGFIFRNFKKSTFFGTKFARLEAWLTIRAQLKSTYVQNAFPCYCGNTDWVLNPFQKSQQT
jgi:hypothetical protein